MHVAEEATHPTPAARGLQAPVGMSGYAASQSTESGTRDPNLFPSSTVKTLQNAGYSSRTKLELEHSSCLLVPNPAIWWLQ